MRLMHPARGLALAISLAAVCASAQPYKQGDALKLKEYVGREWSDELIHYNLAFPKGAFPGKAVKLAVQGGAELPVQLADVTVHEDGSLKSAAVWTVVTLRSNECLQLSLTPGQPAAATDLKAEQRDGLLEVTTAKTGARFNLVDKTFDPPVPAEQTPAYLAAIRQRSGVWGGRGWFETPHTCRRARVWIAEQGPVFVTVGFDYAFDGYRGEGKDYYRGHVRIAARQELVEIVEEFAMGDPAVYQIWKPKTRAEEIEWDWWQWRPHETNENFCFSIYDGLKPTRARWFGHNATIPEKRTGPHAGQRCEMEYPLDYTQDRFDVSVNAYLRGCPDQGKSYIAWRGGDPASDAVGVIGLRAVEWLHPDMLPHLSRSIAHHTDTADLRIYAQKKPDLVVKAPLHLGKRVWGLVTLEQPEAIPTEDEVKDGKVVSPSFQRDSTQALKLQTKYGNRPLDKVKDWTLEWTSTKSYPSLFVKEGGLATVRQRILASQGLKRHARMDLGVIRYLFNPNEKDAQTAFREVADFCQVRIDALLRSGYCGPYLNNNEYPWHLQDMSARFDIVMGMPEVPAARKEELKSLFAFCVNMLQDDEFMPPRTTGVGWGSANMPVNTRGGRCISACALSDNPDAKPWLERAIEYVDVMVTKVWSEDGSPLSCPHYSSTEADPLMNMAMPLYYAGKMPPPQVKYPRLANFTRLLMDRMTPPERRCNYTRVMPTLGHTNLEEDPNIGKYAVLMNLTDRKLGGEAYWMWKRCGCSTAGFLDGIYYMHENFDEVQPQLKSVSYPGSTTTLRNGFPRENETYLLLHAGNQGFDHYDCDVGSFILYAKGAPLMLDFSSAWSRTLFPALWHNTLSWNVQEHELKRLCPGRTNGCFYTAHGYPWTDHQYEPHTELDRTADSQTTAADGYKEYSGEIRTNAFSSEADYVMAAMPLIEFAEWPFLNNEELEDVNSILGAQTGLKTTRLTRKYEWQRRLVFVKDDDLQGPNYHVIADDLDGQAELTPQANFWCLADEQKIDGDRVYWKGQYEVDLDMYVAWPKQPAIATRRWSHTNRGPIQATFKNGKEEQLAAHVKNQPGNGGFTVVLYPRGRYEVQPVFESSKDGKTVQVTIGNRRDVIFCSRQPMQARLGGVSLSGTVAVVKQHPDYTAIVLSEAGTVSAKGWELQADVPVSVRIAGDRLTGQAAGKGNLVLSLGKAWAGRNLLRNGKPAGVFDEAGRVELAAQEPGATLTAEPPASPNRGAK